MVGLSCWVSAIPPKAKQYQLRLQSQRLFPQPFVQRHKAAPIAPISTAVTSTTLPICTMGMPIRTAGMGITTEIAGTEVTTIIGIIDTGAITTRNSYRFDDPATCPRQIMSW